jgi:hypothetical protein
MSRTRRAAMVVLVILAILATPGLISLSDPPQSRAHAPEMGEKVSLGNTPVTVR